MFCNPDSSSLSPFSITYMHPLAPFIFCPCQSAFVISSPLYASPRPFLTSFLSPPSSFLLRTRINWFIFCLSSALLLILAGSATPNPPRMVMPIDPPFYYDLAARSHGTPNWPTLVPRCSRPRPSCMSGRTSAALSSSTNRVHTD
ncbi:hypothetical protein EDB89DRAFT_1219945 [Lactarius sanguifluus]|nr:hypothetical protein EDB89DRAFT_1219945 [Lactarius sanguifluus]